MSSNAQLDDLSAGSVSNFRERKGGREKAEINTEKDENEREANREIERERESLSSLSISILFWVEQCGTSRIRY